MNEQERSVYERMLEKSSEAFVMSLEIYNRPSIRYRVEGFSFFICNAWELMLKAKLIKDDGMESVYYKDNPDRTISLERCIALVFTNKKDPLRKNLESIIGLRNTSTHFIVEEHERIYVGLFQSCVNNFDDKMREFHGKNMSDVVPPHFLTLSMTANPLAPATIRAKYPAEIAEKLLFDEASIQQEQMLLESQRYSTVLYTEIAVVKNPDNADFTVAYDSKSDKPIRTAKVFQDPSQTHPLSVKNIIDHVNRKLERAGISLKANGEDKEFTSKDWALFMRFYDLKNDKEYGYCHEVGNSRQHTYSMKTVDFIFGLIEQNPDGIIDDLKGALEKKKEAS